MAILYLYSIAVIFLSVLILKITNKIRNFKLQQNNSENEDGKTEMLQMSIWTFVKIRAFGLLWAKRNMEHGDTYLTKVVEYLHRQNLAQNIYIIKSFSGIRSFVLANSRDTIRSFFNNEFCTDRWPGKLNRIFHGDELGKGIAFSTGNEKWRELRKYTLKTLGQLGFGKNDKMSSVQNEQLNDLLHRLEKLRDTENLIQVNGLFNVFVLNVMWGIVGGKKFEETDLDFQTLNSTLQKGIKSSSYQLFAVWYFPEFLVRALKAVGFNCNTFIENGLVLKEYFQKYIEQQKAVRDFSGHRADFVDHLLYAIEEHKSDNKFNKIYNVDQFASVLADIFAAGVDTTSSFMECSLMYMVLNPHIQTKVQQEIDTVIGRDFQPTFATHKKSMPYTLATIAEIHRLGNIFPTMIRLITADCKIGNRSYEKGTAVFANFTHLRMNESQWEQPKIFRPERFLDLQNNLITDRVNHLLAFGSGARLCPGENIATSTIFTFFTGILQRFTVTSCDEYESIGLTMAIPFVNHPKPFQITLQSRCEAMNTDKICL